MVKVAIVLFLLAADCGRDIHPSVREKQQGDYANNSALARKDDALAWLTKLTRPGKASAVNHTVVGSNPT
jgi:hypothetical protein